MDLKTTLLCVFFPTAISAEGFRTTNQKELEEAISERVKQAVIADFDEVARQYVMRTGKEYHREVEWWDLYAKVRHIAENHPDKKITVSTGPVLYGTVIRSNDKPEVLYSQWFHNNHSNQPIFGQISRTASRQSSFTWTVDEALKIGMEISSTAGIPESFGANTQFNTQLNLNDTKAKTITSTDAFSISHILPVDPQTSAKAEWIFTDREMEISWEADVYIKGWVAIWFERKYNGHWLWFHPIMLLANDKFHEYDDGLLYKAKGSFFGLRNLESFLKISEYPLINKFQSHLLNQTAPSKETIIDLL